MAPSASILFPTRGRREYLAVALRSVAPQAAAHGAEIVVIEDDAADPETERLVAAHGGRYVALGEERGINVARNAAVEAAAADLLCFIDDDVEAWPGWLAAMLEGARGNPEHEALGGPIRARLEGTNLHPCGREPLPVTSLDLGERRRGRRVRVGLEPHDPAVGDRARRPVRRRAARGRRRRGAVAAAPEGRRRADPLRGGGGRRPPARGARRPAARARTGQLPPRSPRPPLGRTQGHRSLDRRRAAHVGGLRLAHGSPPLRQRDRARGAHARAPARGPCAGAHDRERARARLGVRRLRPALAAHHGDRRRPRRRRRRRRPAGPAPPRPRRPARDRPARARGRGRAARERRSTRPARRGPSSVPATPSRSGSRRRPRAQGNGRTSTPRSGSGRPILTTGCS